MRTVCQVDEIFGSISDLHFSVKPAEGISATSFKPGDKLYINPEKLLPLQRFLPQPKGSGGGGKGKGKPASYCTPFPQHSASVQPASQVVARARAAAKEARGKVSH